MTHGNNAWLKKNTDIIWNDIFNFHLMAGFEGNMRFIITVGRGVWPWFCPRFSEPIHDFFVLSYCKFWIYTHPVNSKFTIWQFIKKKVYIGKFLLGAFFLSLTNRVPMVRELFVHRYKALNIESTKNFNVCLNLNMSPRHFIFMNFSYPFMTK